MTYTGTGTTTKAATANSSGNLASFQTIPIGVTGPISSTNNGVATWNGTAGIALLSAPNFQVSSAGVLTNTNQPDFLTTLQTTVTDAWGDGGTYTFPYPTVIFDQASNYNDTSYTFTAPATGKYLFTAYTLLTNILVGSYASLFLVATSRTVLLNAAAYPTNTPKNARLALNGAVIIDMNATDTAYIQINGETSTGTKVGSFVGSGTNLNANFTGIKIA